MASVEWVKLTTDMFDNRKIKHLRRLPDGNSIVLIWVMLLTMAGRCNAGGMIFLTENIPYTPKMLADELDFEESTVVLALNSLRQLNMIVVDNDYFAIAGWEEYQNIEGLDRIREQTRKRVAAHRQRQAQKALPASNDTCNVTVTQGNAGEKEREEDIDIKNKNDNMGDPADAPERKRYARKPFIPPTVEEVSTYCTERGNSVDAEAFVDFYASKGWMIGKNKMKDWKAAVRTWEQGDKRKGVKMNGGNRNPAEGSTAGRVGTWL
jgi:predicted phage replisome organizer